MREQSGIVGYGCIILENLHTFQPSLAQFPIHDAVFSTNFSFCLIDFRGGEAFILDVRLILTL